MINGTAGNLEWSLEVGTKIYIYVHYHSLKYTASYLIPQS